MKQVTIFLLFLLLSSCSSLRKKADNSDHIILTETNLTLLDGRYERKSVQLNKDSAHGDLYWNLFANTYSFGNEKGLNLKGDTNFVQLKVINEKRILVSHINGNEILTSKIMKGKIKDGYFEFRRIYLFIPMVFVNVYRDSKFRVGLLEDNNLTADFKQISFGTSFVIFPFHEKIEQENKIFKRIKNGL